MIGGGFGAPGQRESIKGGRDQDLLTPIWQTVALCFCGAWCIGWLAAMAMVMGSVLGYALSLAVFVFRWGRKIVRDWGIDYTYTSYAAYFGWILLNLAVHVGIGYVGDLIWTEYVMPWSYWQKLWFVIVAVAMVAPFGVLGYVMVVRLFDPNYPSPRKAVDQRQPQMPWYVDEPPLDVSQLGTPQLVRVQVESKDPRYSAGMLDLAPVREWYDFALWLLRHPDGFSEPNAKRFEVKVDLKSNRPPWYGRGFRQVRDDLFARTWAEWANNSAHEQGIVLHEEALAAFHEFCEAGPPPPPDEDG